MANPRRVKHLLLSATYEADGHIPSKVVTDWVGRFFTERGAEPVGAAAYTTSHFIHPQHGALIDAWTDLSDAERLYIHDQMPRLFTAIFLAIKAQPEETCDEVSRNGSRCRVKGTHDVHVGPPGHDGVISSEVWRTGDPL